MTEVEIEQQLARLERTLGARAAGYWSREPEHLLQRAFVSSPDLDGDVARTFAEATRRIPLDRQELGVVKALLDGVPTISVADELPPHNGSGYWLRAFGAACSVAVPLHDARGVVAAVISLALADLPADEGGVTRQIREVGRSILEG